MAVNVYTGVMGSGKSFEVTLNVIVPAVLKSRRIVTNIDGISEEKIHAYLRKKNPNHQEELGSIVHVSDEDVSKPGFFPDGANQDAPSIVKAGDMVVIDEAWRFWSTDKKLSPEHMQFFRMHRHFSHADTGVSCDLALVFQAIGDVHRLLRAVVEINFRTTKLKTLGLNRSYRIEFWEGGKQTKSCLVGRRVTRYDKQIFPLYKSYAGVGGTEVAVDSRQNVFNNPRLWLLCLLLCGASGYSFWFLWGFFHPAAPKTKGEVAVFPSSRAAPQSSSAATKAPELLRRDLRIGGVVTLPGSRFVVVVDRSGRFVYDSTYGYSGTGAFLAGEHSSKKIDAAPFVD